jgi:polyisoprenoid-binding protein YceI
MKAIAKLVAALFVLLYPLTSYAATLTLTLSPADMLAQTHSRAMFVSVTGTFRQLSGTLTFDPASGACHVDVIFQVESLQLPNALIRSQTMSAGFLDPAEYPQQHYIGDCAGDRLNGNLTMRGQTHPFGMAITRGLTGGRLTSLHLQGTLNRYQWGISGLSMTVGKMITVTNDISLVGAR